MGGLLEKLVINQRLLNCRRAPDGMPGACRQRRWAGGPATSGFETVLLARPSGGLRPPLGTPNDFICSGEVNSPGIKILGLRPKTLDAPYGAPHLRWGPEGAQEKSRRDAAGFLKRRQ